MSMVWIASSIANGSSDTMFTNIPQTFSHLQVRVFSRSKSTGSATDFIYIRCGNSSFIDFSSSYVGHKLIGDGANVASGYTAQTTFLEMPIVTGAQAASGIYGVAIIDILDYADTNKFTTFRAIGGFDANGSGNIRLQSGLYLKTDNINQMIVATGTDYSVAGSRVDLYGITSSQATGA